MSYKKLWGKLMGCFNCFTSDEGVSNLLINIMRKYFQLVISYFRTIWFRSNSVALMGIIHNVKSNGYTPTCDI